MANNFRKGRFSPNNRNKYKGDVSKIIYRSGWELHFMRYLDRHEHIEAWASEPFFIMYDDPVTDTKKRYYPDFLVKKKSGEIILVEIKPLKQTQPPKKRRRTQKFLAEQAVYHRNMAKWSAAENLCRQKGWQFVIMTEKELGK